MYIARSSDADCPLFVLQEWDGVMDEFLTFAYADPATLESTALAERLADGDGHGMIAIPTGEVAIDGLQELQQELRMLFEAIADGRSLPPTTATVHQKLTKPPGRMPPRLAGHYMVVVSGEWRDVVLTLACRLLSVGHGGKLARCAICRRAFQAQRSTATICGAPGCKKERNRQGYERWVSSPAGQEKRIESWQKQYDAEGWTLGARDLALLRKGTHKRRKVR